MITIPFLESVTKLFKYYKVLGDRTFEQLNEEELFYQANEASNSIAIIVKHMSGNMLSRWTDFLISDGEKEWRDRDDEFVCDFQTKKDLLRIWEEGWTCLFDALSEVDEHNIDQVIYIRNMGQTIQEAIHRQLGHYAYHVGQIVYVGRMINDESWNNLSIPKGLSKEYNKEKFEQPKHLEHFTKEILDPNSSI